MKKIWNRFTAWLSGWPESKAKKEREEDFLFVEEELKETMESLHLSILLLEDQTT